MHKIGEQRAEVDRALDVELSDSFLSVYIGQHLLGTTGSGREAAIDAAVSPMAAKVYSIPRLPG